MFDYLRCEPDTPDGWKPKDGLFQTKDLDRTMVTHTITIDGRLVMEEITDTETVPKHERPYPDAPEGDLRSMIGSIRTHARQVEASDYHGWLNFNAGELIEDPNGTVVRVKHGWHHGGSPDNSVDGKRYRYVSHDYRAKFTDGRLVEIVLANRLEG